MSTFCDSKWLLHCSIVVMFPCSLHTQSKNRKEWGEPGKIYHLRNVTGRENLITCGRINSPTLYWQTILDYSFKLWKLYGRQNRTRRHYATLPGSIESYGERTQTHIFENHTNLLTYLTTDCCILRTMAQGTIKCKGGPFLGFAQAFSVHVLFARMGSY